MILADVAGHGETVADVARLLKKLMRKFMNAKSQLRLVHQLNQEFTRLGESGRFATAVVATYLSHRHRFTICNAGHPRPIWYRAQAGVWSFVDDSELIETGDASNLPLGFDSTGAYVQLDLKLGDGDILILYTDALVEARDPADRLLGEADLLRIVAELPTNNVRALGLGVLDGVRSFAGGARFDDDATIVVMKFSKALRRIPGLGERLRGYAKWFGWQAAD